MNKIKEYFLNNEADFVLYIKESGICKDYRKKLPGSTINDMCFLPDGLSANISYISKEINTTTFLYQRTILFQIHIQANNDKITIVELNNTDSINDFVHSSRNNKKLQFFSWFRSDLKEWKNRDLYFAEKLYTEDQTLKMLDKCFKSMFLKLKLRLKQREIQIENSNREQAHQAQVRKQQHLNKISNFFK